MLRGPIVSIIIVTWNSQTVLSTCLDRLSKQTFHDFEVILVDNGSNDGSLEQLHIKYPNLDLRIEELGSNLGFAAANNIGARLARGKWLALLNADAFPEPDWLEKLLCAAEENPGYLFFSSRQIQANKPEFLDGTGDVYHISGLAWRQHYSLPSKQFGLQAEEVFSACGAAALYSREEFLQVGGFDEDYFSYFEDVDLGFRLRLNGTKCLYVPEAIVHHVGSASTGKLSDFVIYHGHRNLVWTYLKNMPTALMVLYFPLFLAMNSYFLLSFSLKGRGPVIWRAKRDAWRGLSNMLRKRKEVQHNRRASITSLWRVMERSLLAPIHISIQRRRFLNHD
jgi:GT2 family glycosyltransferase